MMQKISIGTAQFGLNYGIANQTGKTKFSDVKRILNLAKENNIYSLDTAIQYGDSETVLGNCNVHDWDIVTKIPSLREDCNDICGYFLSEIENSLSRLNIESFDGVLIHDINQLLDKSSRVKEIFKSLEKIKINGLARKIGLSIYNPEDLANINHLESYDIIQCPFNIIDRRLLESGWLSKLKKANIEVHVRSIFLQGLLLMQSHRRPLYFNQWSGVLGKYDEFLKDSNFKKLEVCLNFPLQFKEIDKVIIGVDNFNQFNEMINSLGLNDIKYPDNLASEQSGLINPSSWDF